VEWANLPHDIAETLELVIVSISIVLGLAVLVAFGQWWQR
jgi:ABC-type arginine/histidine transport system permease subunit